MNAYQKNVLAVAVLREAMYMAWGFTPLEIAKGLGFDAAESPKSWCDPAIPYPFRVREILESLVRVRAAL